MCKCRYSLFVGGDGIVHAKVVRMDTRITHIPKAAKSQVNPVTFITQAFFRCPVADNCPGEGKDCEDHSEKVLCAKCVYGFKKFGGKCTECRDVGTRIAVLVFICVFGLVVLSIMITVGSSKNDDASIVLRIFLSWSVVIATVGDFKARGPEELLKFLQLPSFLSNSGAGFA